MPACGSPTRCSVRAGLEGVGVGGRKLMFCPPSLIAGLQKGGAPGMRPTAAQQLSVLVSEMGLTIPVPLSGSRKLLASYSLSHTLSQAVPLPLQESFIFAAIGKAGSAHAQVLHQP